MTGKIFAYHSIPPYHGMGVMAMFWMVSIAYFIDFMTDFV